MMMRTISEKDRMETRLDLIRHISRIDLATGALVEGLQPGRHHSVFRGQGLEFADIREYVPGDDLRSIDWKVTARFDHPFVREYTEERDQTFYFVVDISGSGSFGSGETKQRKMLEVTASLAFAALRNNDRIGLCLCSDRVEKFLPAGRGKKHLVALLNTLIDHRAASLKTDLKAAGRFLGSVLSCRSSIIILSDFATPDFQASLRLLRKRHEVIGIQITDPREYELPDIGRVVFEDPETGEQVSADTSDPAFRERYRALAREADDVTAAGFRQSGGGFLTLRTTDRYDIPLKGFFAGLKCRGRRHGRVC
jgi:uncharacterized protein (DUF58 family)